MKQFAHSGYAGTSVAEIVRVARVAKPSLYYYFHNKAGLYQALVDHALDERFRLVQEAAARGKDLREKLTNILAALFAFQTRNRELIRLTFATVFASPGEVPENTDYMARRQRNFNFIHSLIKKEWAVKRLNRKFDSQELAFGIHGLMNIYVMAHLILPKQKLNRKTAERIVELFLSGAAGDVAKD